MASEKQAKKAAQVMREYHAGKLHTGKKGPGKGPIVKSEEQAKAIAMSVSGQSKMKSKKKAKKKDN